MGHRLVDKPSCLPISISIGLPFFLVFFCSQSVGLLDFRGWLRREWLWGLRLIFLVFNNFETSLALQGHSHGTLPYGIRDSSQLQYSLVLILGHRDVLTVRIQRVSRLITCCKYHHSRIQIDSRVARIV